MPLVAANCDSWRTAEVEPRAVIESEHPHYVRVTTHDSTRYVLRGPRIVADTLFGRGDDGSVSVALRDVTRLDVLRFSPAKTAVLVLVVGGVLVGLVMLTMEVDFEGGLWALRLGP